MASPRNNRSPSSSPGKKLRTIKKEKYEEDNDKFDEELQKLIDPLHSTRIKFITWSKFLLMFTFVVHIAVVGLTIALTALAPSTPSYVAVALLIFSLIWAIAFAVLSEKKGKQNRVYPIMLGITSLVLIGGVAAAISTEGYDAIRFSIAVLIGFLILAYPVISSYFSIEWHTAKSKPIIKYVQRNY